MDKYELNIAYTGFHWAKVILPSTDDESAKAYARIFKERFSEKAFEISLSAMANSGRFVSF